MKRSLSPSFCAALCLCAGGLCGIAGYFAGRGHSSEGEPSRRARRIGLQSASGGDHKKTAEEPKTHMDGWGGKINGAMTAAHAGEPSAAYAALRKEAVKLGQPLAASSRLQAIS